MEKRKIYPLFDIAKFGCALLILFYHYFSEHGQLPALFEDVLSLYAVAVALFMTLSGYLLFIKFDSTSSRTEQWEVTKKQVKRILRIYLFWSIPYLIFSIYCWPWPEVNFNYVLWQLQHWIFNSTFYTIWFMPALAIGILLSYFLYSRLSWGKVCLIALLFYIMGSMQTTYRFVGEFITEAEAFRKFSEVWLQGGRGGIFFGMPLVILGGLAAKTKKIRPVFYMVMSAIVMLCLLAEAVILRKYVGGCGVDLAFFMLPTCFFITMFLRSFSCFPTEQQEHALHWLRAMSITVFMSQRLFLTVIPFFFNAAVRNFVFSNSYLGAVIIGGGTILFSALIIHLSSRYRIFKLLY